MSAGDARRVDMPANPPELDEPGWGADALYLLVDNPKPSHRGFGPSRLKDGTPIGLVHVISKHRGGEIRGFWIVDGVLELRHPTSPRRWFSLDAAVSRVLGMTVVDRGAP